MNIVVSIARLNIGDNNIKDIARAYNLVYISQTRVKDIKRLIEIGKLINKAKQQGDNIGELM